MGGTALVEGHTGRGIPAPQGRPILLAQLQHGPELQGRDLALLAEGLADQELSGLVVKDERAGSVDEEHRRGQVGGQLPGEDKGKALGGSAGHGRQR